MYELVYSTQGTLPPNCNRCRNNSMRTNQRVLTLIRWNHQVHLPKRAADRLWKLIPKAIPHAAGRLTNMQCASHGEAPRPLIYTVHLYAIMRVQSSQDSSCQANVVCTPHQTISLGSTGSDKISCSHLKINLLSDRACASHMQGTSPSACGCSLCSGVTGSVHRCF